MTKFTIPLTADPADNYTDKIDSSGKVIQTARDEVTYMEDIISRQEIQVYVKS